MDEKNQNLSEKKWILFLALTCVGIFLYYIYKPRDSTISLMMTYGIGSYYSHVAARLLGSNLFVILFVWCISYFTFLRRKGFLKGFLAFLIIALSTVIVSFGIFFFQTREIPIVSNAVNQHFKKVIESYGIQDSKEKRTEIYRNTKKESWGELGAIELFLKKEINLFFQVEDKFSAHQKLFKPLLVNNANNGFDKEYLKNLNETIANYKVSIKALNEEERKMVTKMKHRILTLGFDVDPTTWGIIDQTFDNVSYILISLVDEKCERELELANFVESIYKFLIKEQGNWDFTNEIITFNNNANVIYNKLIKDFKENYAELIQVRNGLPFKMLNVFLHSLGR